MKKILFILPLALSFLCILSCTKGSTYRHTVAVLYPAGVGTIFADQSSDSVVFATSDNFEVYSAGESWLKVLDSQKYPKKLNFPYDYYSYLTARVNLEFEPNLTEKVRYADVHVHSFGPDEWDQRVAAHYAQLNCHNIVKPSLTPVAGDDRIVVSYSCEAKDSATQKLDSIVFKAYDAWTLTLPEDAFLTVSKTEGEAGMQRIGVNLTENAGKEERSNVVVLKSSNGATTHIKFTQAAPKEKK